MGKNGDDDQVLLKEREFFNFDRLVKKAEAEGRIDGPSKCLVCGMSYLNKREADDCCRLAEEPGGVPEVGPIMGSGKSSRKKVLKPIKAEPHMISPEALDVEFVLDKSMFAVLDSIDFNELLPEEIIQRSSDTDRSLLVILLAILFDGADGNTSDAFKTATKSGMKLHRISWGKMVNQLKQLEVLIPMITDHDDSEDEIIPDKSEDENSEE